jgi:hypothetical protein
MGKGKGGKSTPRRKKPSKAEQFKALMRKRGWSEGDIELEARRLFPKGKAARLRAEEKRRKQSLPRDWLDKWE